MSEMTPNEVKLASRMAENSTRLRYLREEHPDQVDEIRSQPVEEIIEEILQPNVQVAFPAEEILAVEEVEIVDQEKIDREIRLISKLPDYSPRLAVLAEKYPEEFTARESLPEIV